MSEFETSKWIIRHCVELICLCPSWNEVMSTLLIDIRDAWVSDTMDQSMALQLQILLHLVGYNTRYLWKESKAYTPELLREPYVRHRQQVELIQTISNKLRNQVRKIATSRALSTPTLQLRDTARQLVRDILYHFLSDTTRPHKLLADRQHSTSLPKTITPSAPAPVEGNSPVHRMDPMDTHQECATVPHHEPQLPVPHRSATSESSAHSRKLCELLGWYLLATFHHGRFLTVIAPSLHTSSMATATEPFLTTTGVANHYHSLSSSGTTMTNTTRRVGRTARAVLIANPQPAGQHEIIEQRVDGEAIDLADGFLAKDVDRVCEKLQGILLPESLRGHIWVHRSLRRDWDDPPVGAPWMMELHRQGKERGLEYDMLTASHYPVRLPSHSTQHHRATQHRQQAYAASVTDLSRSAVQRMFLRGFPIRVAVLKSSKNVPAHQSTSVPMESGINMASNPRLRRRFDDAHFGLSNSSQNGHSTHKRARNSLSADFITDAKEMAVHMKHATDKSSSDTLPAADTAVPAPQPPPSSSTAAVIGEEFVSEKGPLGSLLPAAGIASTCLHQARQLSIVPGATAQVLRSRYKSGKMTDLASTVDVLSDSVICRRAELLVKAAFLLTGEINTRTATISILILMTFPQSAPVSEKTLALFMYIYTHCMPSEQMHHSYSILSVAYASFMLLAEEDSELYKHLQNRLEARDQFQPAEGDTDDHDVPSSSRSCLKTSTQTPHPPTHTIPPISRPYRVHKSTLGQSEPSDLSAATMKVDEAGGVALLPACYRLLHDWLETGFLGYIPEFSVLFIWDQMQLWGGKKRDWQTLLPHCCCAILKLLRSDLLAVLTEDEMYSVVGTKGKNLSSKAIFEALRSRLKHLPRSNWFSSPFLHMTNVRLAAVTYIQKLVRGRIARRRLAKLRGETLQILRANKAEIDARVKEWEAADERRRQQILRDRDKAGLLPPGVRANSSVGNNNFDDDDGLIQERNREELLNCMDDLINDVCRALENRSSGDKDAAGGIGDKQRVEENIMDSHRTEETDYAMEDIDEEALMNELREQYAKEWADLRGLSSDDADDADGAGTVTPISHPEEKDTTVPTGPVDAAATAPVDIVDDNDKSEPVAGELTERNDDQPLQEAPMVATTPADNPNQEGAEEAVTSIPPTARPTATGDHSEEEMEEPHSKQTEESVLTPLSTVSSRSARRSTSRSTASRKFSRRKSSVMSGVGDYDSDEETEKGTSISSFFRANIPKPEVDAVMGFFLDLREDIGNLLMQKRKLKLQISEWKADYFVVHGKQPSWAERKGAIANVYDKYQEVGYNLKKALKELRLAEDDLLRSWQEKKEVKRGLKVSSTDP